MDEQVQQFLKRHHAAVMVTLKRDGTPHVARVTIALVDEGRLIYEFTVERAYGLN